jgi:multidrug resistance efflux pump
VIAVRQYAQANKPLKKGDLLLQFDPAPYRYEVDQLDAQLNVSRASEAAEENVTTA